MKHVSIDLWYIILFSYSYMDAVFYKNSCDKRRITGVFLSKPPAVVAGGSMSCRPVRAPAFSHLCEATQPRQSL